MHGALLFSRVQGVSINFGEIDAISLAYTHGQTLGFTAYASKKKKKNEKRDEFERGTRGR